jgi:hypothetical protein
MKTKGRDIKSLPGRFVMCPNSLLERSDVTSLERNLWLVLKARCCKKDSCNPSVADLCSFVGIVDSRCRQVLKVMEAKGILRTEYQNGRSKTYFPLEPPRHSTGAVRQSDPATRQAGGRLSTGAVRPKARLSTGDETDIVQIKETDKSQPSASTIPEIKSSRKASKDPDPRVKQLIDYFCDTHEAKFGHKYIVSGGRDGKILKDLLSNGLSVEDIKCCIDALFLDQDEWLNGKRSIPVLKIRVNQYLQEATARQSVPTPAAFRKLPDLEVRTP